jgi:hypothetical protein
MGWQEVVASKAVGVKLATVLTKGHFEGHKRLASIVDYVLQLANKKPQVVAVPHNLIPLLLDVKVSASIPI